MPLTFGSMFAGVGGMDLGFEAADWQCKWQIEWDPNCQQTLQYHWPSVPKWLDVRDVDGRWLPPVDVVTFGSPCQDLSVAGARKGLDGERSGLFFEATRIIREMQSATNGFFPKWAIWENVAGALSSRAGDDFEAVLKEMVKLGAYICEWAILDAQFFGVPQRRKRVFLVCCFDPAIASRSPEQILAVGKGGDRNPKKRRKPRNSSSIGNQTGVSTFGFSHQVSKTQPTVIDGRRIGDVRFDDSGVMRTLEARMGTGGNNVPYMTIPSSDGFSPVRSLTPIECERLQGWPDNHTKYRIDGKVNTDSVRYKMCGNGVTSPVAKWIAQQINNI